MADQTSTPRPGNELYFTTGTRRYERIGNTLVVVTEGARITITLGDITRIGVSVTDSSVVVNKTTRKAAQATENKPAAAKPQASKPAAAKPAARKPAGAAK
jgi:hypothetical protein